MDIENSTVQSGHRLAVRLLIGAILLGGRLDAQDRSGPLLVGYGATNAPFITELPTGEYEGFALDLSREVARRIGRSGIRLVRHDRADVFDALLARDFEMIASPTNITPDRARRVLFSEGYMDTGLGFLVFQGSELRDIRDLRGRILAVGTGSVSDTWASMNEAWLGFSVQRHQVSGDALSAVINRSAFASLSDLPAATHAAKELGIVRVALSLPISGKFGLALHPDDDEMRNRVEDALECMKLDGTLSELHKRWFGFDAGDDTATNTVYVGYGHPGLDGHAPEPHVPSCG